MILTIKTLTGAAAFWSAAAVAHADSFAERWPKPDAVDSVIAQAEPAPMPARISKRRCQRISFTRDHHRYWSCKR